MLVLFGSFGNKLQGLLIWQIQVIVLQNSIRLNPTFLYDTILNVMKIKINIYRKNVKTDNVVPVFFLIILSCLYGFILAIKRLAKPVPPPLPQKVAKLDYFCPKRCALF